MVLHRITSVLVAGACAVGLSGCASDSGGASAALTKGSFADTVSAATVDATSVHVRADLIVHGQKVEVDGDVAVNGRTVSDLAARLDIDVAGHGSAALLITDGAAYLNSRGLGLPSEHGKPWLKLDITDPGNPIGAGLGQIMAQLDPAMLARAFRAITQLDRVGTESVDGVDTTHYVVTVDTMKALRLLGLEDLAGVNIDDLRTSLPKTFDYDAWLDDSGRPVRLKARYAGACIDVHLSQWGEPVSVSAPPASQVSQFSF